ncbi:dehydrogenase/reductase SDR family member 1-like isoform X2 [Clavelina lepadiformis]|uniref:dehydrogenase/reductase SDR family member 1-like isoform X2 n=1 Tax=Clavelina lepadiformis TaxID=159417 RepID=UPI004043306B
MVGHSLTEERGSSGKCVPVQCDHTNEENTKKVFEKIAGEQNGQLDLLVNNAYAAISHVFGKSDVNFWDQDIAAWDLVNNVGLRNHYICSVYAARMMVPKRKGLIVNISSVGGKLFLFMPPYGIGKAANDRMAKDCAVELEKYNITFVSLWPDKTILKKTGQILLTTDLADEYNFKDVNGNSPISGRSLRLLTIASGWYKTAAFIPEWIKFPKWFYVMLLSIAPPLISPKLPSQYE